MAQDVLDVQVFSIPSELAFSTTGKVLDYFQSTSNPIVVQTLI